MKQHCDTHRAERKIHYGVRKFKIGVASVALGISFLGIGLKTSVQADETVNPKETVSVGKDSIKSVDTVPAVEGSQVASISNPEMTPVFEGGEKENPKIEAETNPINPDSTKQPMEAIDSVETDNKTSDSNVQTIAGTSTDKVATVETSIESGNIRLHFESLPDGDPSSLGLWTWDDVETPSDKKGSWPTGATSFSEAVKDDYGYYMDVKLASNHPKKLSFLINNTTGENLTGDKNIEILSPQMDEVWIDKEYKVHTVKPIPDNTIRIHYYRTDGDYSKKSLWYWGDVKDAPTTWPDGVDFSSKDKYGVYVDIPLAEAAKSIGFLLLDESKTGDEVKIQADDYKFSDVQKTHQLFVKDADPTIYTNPYFVKDIRLTGAQQLSPKVIELTFTNIENGSEEELLKELSITDKEGHAVKIDSLKVNIPDKKVELTGEFSATHLPYTVRYGSESFQTGMSWQLKDALYKYDGELGARVKENGKKVDLSIWSPSADKVEVIVYDRQDQTKEIAEKELQKGESGTWHLNLLASDLGVDNLIGYYYHYRITRDGHSVLVLDPYAKSLAAWNSGDADKGESYKIAKGAFVDPASYGPQDLDYAKIPNFKSREDAIIYEAHVRDFTSDKTISSELKHQFGTFAAFAERLDYLKGLGVTHIQLLPVLSYYFVNELKNGQRLDTYASSNSNYNWGYDPQNYFSLTGMYSENPKDPGKRIEEFKNLVAAIHERGMGIILDVVYNHTAKTSIFEDLEPNYYHFMDADGTPRTSFGGGRLGTTHYMSRRVLVDSITYLTKEFKVDGFRFDMMGDHDAESIEQAYYAARQLNPNLIMLGEGWVTYAGDENRPVQPADQSWMKKTDTVAVFSDDIRNTLKSGYPNEGTPAFITGGKRDVEKVFANIKAQPTNFEADSPGDVIQYIAAHDNLTLFDIIAQSIKKDPSKAENEMEIHRRLRLGNLMILTSQGTPFIHSGQEYGRTKQFRDPAYRNPVEDDQVPNKSHLLVSEDGTPFEYPYFIHDSYDSSDAVNHFDWSKALDAIVHPENVKSQQYTKNLIALRKSTDAFHLGTKEEVDKRVKLLTIPGVDGVATEDLVLGYQTTATNGDRYFVFVNADQKERSFTISGLGLEHVEVLADSNQVSLTGISHPEGVKFSDGKLFLQGITATILRLKKELPSNGTTSVQENEWNNKDKTLPTPIENHVSQPVDIQQSKGTIKKTEQISTSISLGMKPNDSYLEKSHSIQTVNALPRYENDQQDERLVENSEHRSLSQQSSQSVVLPRTGDDSNLDSVMLGVMAAVTGLGLVARKKD